MATEEEKSRYPHLSTKNWWDLRKKFQKDGYPSKITLAYIKPVLSIDTDITAQRIISQLELIGFINKDGELTPLAKKEWTSNESYSAVCKKILESVYPTEIKEVFKSPDPKSVNTIAKQFLDSDSTRNRGIAQSMARFYLLLLKADPSDQDKASTKSLKVLEKVGKKEKRESEKAKPGREKKAVEKTNQEYQPQPTQPSLHVDIQIHIDKDAKPEQIDKIFESMAKHIYKQP